MSPMTTFELEVYDLEIDYSQTLEQMLAAGNGRYDTPSKRLNPENFPVELGPPEIPAVLMHLGRHLTEEEVVRELGTLKLRSCTMVELIAFCNQYFDPDCDFPIVALGAVCIDPNGLRHFGFLSGGAGGYRALGLYPQLPDHRFGSNCRFLVTPRESF